MAFAHFVKNMITLETHRRPRDKSVMITIGQRIREARESLRLTQQQLADRLGVDQSTVSGWERDDKRRPARDLMPVVARALGRTTAWLEGREAELADRGRDYDGPETNEPRGNAPESIDTALLTEVIQMAMRNLVAAHGVDIPTSRFEAAADAAAAAYHSYYRLRRAS